MISPFEKLTREELEDLYLTPVWISILIAGEDNTFTKREIKNAVKIANNQTKTGSGFIDDFYRVVTEKFEINMKGFITLLPRDTDKRTNYLIKRLTGVNELLKKINLEHAQQLYSSFREFACGVAKSAGGLFGLLSVSFAESKFIDLKMIRDPAGIKN